MASGARLEIHQIDVGAGDSTLIVNRNLDQVYQNIKKSGKLALTALNKLDSLHYVPFAVQNKVSLANTVVKALLVDGGDDEYGGNVFNYLVEHGAIDPKKVNQPKLSVLVSHFHDDHAAGLRYILRKRAGDKAPWKRRACPATIYQAATKDKMSPCCTQWRTWVKEDAAAGATKLVEVYPGGLTAAGGTTPIAFGLGLGVDNIPITVALVASGEQVRVSTSCDLERITKKKTKGFDPNDRSLVAVLEYGSFRLFLGGDIAGDGGPAGGNTDDLEMGKKSGASATHGDVETVLGKALRNLFRKTTTATVDEPKFTSHGYCTVMKSNHHGSDSSNDVHLFSVIRPLIFQNSGGLRPQPHGHPTQQVILRATNADDGADWSQPPYVSKTATIKNTVDGLYLTEVAQKWATNTRSKKPGQKTRKVDLRDARIVGDIVVRPLDQSISGIQAADDFGETLTVQVYGTGDQFDIAEFNKRVEAKLKGKYGLFPATVDDADDVESPADTYYFLGPWRHKDTH